MRPRQRLLAALLLGAAIAVLLYQRCSTRSPAPVARATEVARDARADWKSPTAWREAPMQAPELVRTPSPAAFIDAVRVDRTEVCANEPVLVEVDARDKRESGGPLRVQIGQRAAGRRAVVAFGTPGEQDLTVRAIAEDKASDTRVVKIQVHDCAGAYQFVHVRTEAAEGQDAYRFIATPFFDRPECASAPGPDGGPVSRADLMKCHARPVAGESLSYRWEFGDGSTTTGDTHVVSHSYADRIQDEIETNAIVRVTVESSLYGSISGFTNVLLVNVSARNKLRVGVITPSIVLGARLPGGDKTLEWEAVVQNPDRQTLSLDEIEVSLSTCEGGEGKTTRHPARRVLDATVLPPGRTKTTARMSTADVAPDDCFVSFSATGTSPEGHRVSAVFGARVRAAPDAVTFGPNETDPALKKRYERTIKALNILGRGKDGGPATVSDDEIRELELKGLLD